MAGLNPPHLNVTLNLTAVGQTAASTGGQAGAAVFVVEMSAVVSTSAVAGLASDNVKVLDV